MVLSAEQPELATAEPFVGPIIEAFPPNATFAIIVGQYMKGRVSIQTEETSGIVGSSLQCLNAIAPGPR
jgi:hypothetical protein